MSKPRKMDLKGLIAGNYDESAPDIAPTPPEPVVTAPEPTAEVVTLQQPKPAVRAAKTVAAAAPEKARAGEGNIKQRAVQMTLYLEQPSYDQLRELAFTERTKMHPLILEAIDLLFKKRGLKSLAELQKQAS